MIRKSKFEDVLQVDTAMTAVSAGPGKSASQIFFYDWSDNYRRVIKVEDKNKLNKTKQKTKLKKIKK